MSTVKPEPLALEVALAHYVASLPEGKSVVLEELAGEPNSAGRSRETIGESLREALSGKVMEAGHSHERDA